MVIRFYKWNFIRINLSDKKAGLMIPGVDEWIEQISAFDRTTACNHCSSQFILLFTMQADMFFYYIYIYR